jgi:hypothetical protein
MTSLPTKMTFLSMIIFIFCNFNFAINIYLNMTFVFIICGYVLAF